MVEMQSDLIKIPGVGVKIERRLNALGFWDVQSLEGQDPEDIYIKDCLKSGVQLDRCLLYVYRLAVYFAENEKRDPEKLKWWNWKDEKPG